MQKWEYCWVSFSVYNQDDSSHENYAHYKFESGGKGFRIVSSAGDSQPRVHKQMDGMGTKVAEQALKSFEERRKNPNYELFDYHTKAGRERMEAANKPLTSIMDELKEIIEESSKRPGIVGYRQCIAQLGLEGWEIITISRDKQENGYEEIVWFKRPLAE